MNILKIYFSPKMPTQPFKQAKVWFSAPPPPTAISALVNKTQNLRTVSVLLTKTAPFSGLKQIFLIYSEYRVHYEK